MNNFTFELFLFLLSSSLFCIISVILNRIRCIDIVSRIIGILEKSIPNNIEVAFSNLWKIWQRKFFLNKMDIDFKKIHEEKLSLIPL